MVHLDLRIHPNVVFAYTANHIDLIMRVENRGETSWSEADAVAPEGLSLSPDRELRKGRVRIGITERNQYLEKSIRVFANIYTKPQVYRCKVTLYTFNKNGIIDNRFEKPVDIRCEMKRKETI